MHTHNLKLSLTAAAFLLTASSLAYAGPVGSAGQYIDDAAITAKVKAALLADSQTKAMEITVDTNQGVVLLKGAVDTKDQEADALRTAARVDGVKSVADKITVNGSQE